MGLCLAWLEFAVS